MTFQLKGVTTKKWGDQHDDLAVTFQLKGVTTLTVQVKYPSKLAQTFQLHTSLCPPPGLKPGGQGRAEWLHHYDGGSWQVLDKAQERRQACLKHRILPFRCLCWPGASTVLTPLSLPLEATS